ncbi:MAG: hypothetical protein IJP62_03580 [Treponema sp.]|nr:hypothetical protein [Treponema sp.]
MKKTLAVLAAIAMSVTGAFAYTHNFGVGFTMPISQVGVDKTGLDDIFQIGYGVHGFYSGILDKGFTFKASESVGIATSNDMPKIGPSKADVGVFSNLDVGAGWTFIQNGKMTLSALGMLGMYLAAYPKTDEETILGKKHEYSYTAGVVMFDVGADLYFSYKIGNHWGLFANIAGRYLIAGTEFGSIEDKEDKTTTTTTIDMGDLRGKFMIQPTIGVCWKF